MYVNGTAFPNSVDADQRGRFQGRRIGAKHLSLVYHHGACV